MQYRKFGRLDWDVSVLGFGAMRLPTLGEPRDIDRDEATRMLRYALDHGVNYIDTAYPYHGGESERLIGSALGDGRREKVRLATKMPSWLIETSSDFDRIFSEQLERLRTERIDFYLFHNLNKDYWPKLRGLGALEWAERETRRGRIGKLGFSFHDRYELFREIIDAWDWDLCQIQYNYMDVDNQAGTRGLRYASAKGIAVVVMEPILGGKLANPPASIRGIWEEADRRRTPAEWALHWLWDQPEVSVVLSGMSTFEQVVDNVKCAHCAAIGSLTGADQELVRRVRQSYQSLSPIPCTQCGYCLPCAHGVDIPRNLTLYSEGVMYARPDLARRGYSFVPESARAVSCVQCRECEPRCPQEVPISTWMPRVDEVLGQGRPYDEHTP